MNLLALPRQIQTAIQSFMAGRGDIQPVADPRLFPTMDPALPDGFPRYWDALFGGLRTPNDRVREARYYDFLEREVPDTRKALDAFATMATTGNLAGGGTGTFVIRRLLEDDKYPDELKARHAQMETIFARHSYSTVRAMCKYGSYMPQLMVGLKKDGRKGVTGLRAIPPATIFRYIDQNGNSTPDKYWVQIINGRVPGTNTAAWAGGEPDRAVPAWILPHFAIWSNLVTATETLVYGTSILQPFGAIALKMHSVLDAMVVARLSRAAMRYIWKVDVTDIRGDQKAIERRVQRWMQRSSRTNNLMAQSNTKESYERANVPDSDFYVPAGEGLHWDLDKIEGDNNLSRVGDAELLSRFYFGALGVPPEYLGHERSQGGRSNLSQSDIQFARNTRHIQMFAASGFEHMLYVDMILGGFDPDKYPCEVVPPQIGARDDLLQAQIRALQAAVLTDLAACGMDFTLNPRWVLSAFMSMDDELKGLSEDQIKKLFKVADAMAPTDQPPSKPPSSKAMSKAREALMKIDPAVLDSMRRDFRMLIPDVDGTRDDYRIGQPSLEVLREALNAQ